MSWMLDALEADWAERISQARLLMEADQEAAKQCLSKSMIFGYLETMEGRNGRRRVLRSIFANGDQKSLNEFPEVWLNETKERKRKVEDLDTTPRKRLNLDEDDFGDYGVEDDDDVFDSPAPEGADTAVMPEDEDEAIDVSGSADLFEIGTAQLGGIDAVDLRHRLMALLYSVALDLPRDFTHIEDLFDLFTEFIRPLSLSQFSVLATNPFLHAQARLALLVNHLLPLQSMSMKGGNIFKIHQEQLTSDFLPKAANAYTVVDNAKVSLALEACLLTLIEYPGVQANDEFSAAIGDGIKARKKRAIADGRKKGKGMVGEEKYAGEVLELSSQRLLAVLEAAQAAAGITRTQSQPQNLDGAASSLSELSSVSDDDM